MLMVNDRNANIVGHILEYCRQIEATFTKFGNNFDDFLADPVFRNAVSMVVFQIGELSGRLSDDFKEQHKSAIPWKEVRGMRNLFAHNYLEMDVQKIWDSATVDVPVLRKFCESVLSDIERQTSSEVREDDSALNIPARQAYNKPRSSLDDRLKQAKAAESNKSSQEQEKTKTQTKKHEESLE